MQAFIQLIIPTRHEARSHPSLHLFTSRRKRNCLKSFLQSNGERHKKRVLAKHSEHDNQAVRDNQKGDE